jgi:hypothetical protein
MQLTCLIFRNLPPGLKNYQRITPFYPARHLRRQPQRTQGAVIHTTAIKMAPLYAHFATNNSGHLNVSDVHSIYYEECGLQTGVPILYLHGGPGGGIADGDR